MMLKIFLNSLKVSVLDMTKELLEDKWEGGANSFSSFGQKLTRAAGVTEHPSVAFSS